MKGSSGVQAGRALLAISFLFFSHSSFAVATGSGVGYGLRAQVSLGSYTPINVPYAPNPPAEVSSTGSDTEQVVSLLLNIDAGLLGKPVSLSTGVIKGNAQASLNGFATDSVLATGEVDNLNIGVSALVPVIGVTADVLQGTAQASCSNGQTVLAGNAVITNLKVNVLGLPISVPIAPGPNTGLSSSLLGLSILLNEQSKQANQITVNALHVTLNNFLLSALLGNLNVDIAVGTAVASMQSACARPPALSLSKVADGIFVRGSNGGYTFNITNVGGATAQTGLTLTDVLPVGLTYVSASGTGWSCNAAAATPAGQTVTCNNATTALAAGGASSVHIVVSVGASAPNPVVNTAVVGNPDQPPPTGCTSANPPNGCATTTTPVQPAPLPILTLLKVANGSFVRGGIGSYNLTVSNIGAAIATAPITVIDALPAGMSYVAVSGTGWSCTPSGQTVTCTNPSSLPLLGTSSFTLSVNIAANTSSTVVNTASVGSGNDPAPNCVVGSIAQGCASATTPVIDAAVSDLQLGLTSSPVFIRGGGNNTYMYSITNSGNTTAIAPITLASNLTTGVTFGSIVGSSSPNGSWVCAGNAFPCAYSQSVGPGETTSVTVQVNVAANAPSQVENVAGAGNAQQPTPTTCGTVASTQCASVTTAVQDGTSPHLTMTKTAIGSFVRGANGSYSFAVTNSGTAATTGFLAITDTLPTGLSFSSFSGSGWNCSASAQVVTCTTSMVLPINGSNQVLINVAIAGNAPNTEVNNAVVGSDNDPAPDCSVHQVDGCATSTTPVNDPPSQGQPHLTLSKTANGSFVRGATGNYTVVATNSGNAPTSGTITIVDTLPAGLTYTGSSGSDWSCTASGQIVTCSSAAVLIVGASSQLSISVSIASNAPNPVVNTAVVGTPGDPAPTCTPPVDGCASTTTPVGDPPPQGQAHLILSKAANGSFVRGAIGSYTLTVANTGTATASAPISLIDTLPAGLSYSSAGGTGWSCSASGQVVTCTSAAALAAGAQSQIVLSVAISTTAPSLEVNNAVVGTPAQPPPSCTPPVDGCATTTTPVNDPPLQGQAHLTLTKVANGSFVAGNSAGYTLTVTNTGSASADAPISLIDSLPAGLSFVDARGSDSGWSCTSSGQTVTCAYPSALASGASTSVMLTVQIASTVTSSVVNNATVGNPQNPPPGCATLVDGCAITTTPVISGPPMGPPILALSKSHQGNFTVGMPGDYTLTLRNIGTTSTAGPIFIEDQLPKGMEYSSMSSSDSAWSCSGLAVVECSADTLVLDSGQATTLTISVYVGFDAIGMVVNHADASGGGLAMVDCSKTPSSPACASDPTQVDANALKPVLLPLSRETLAAPVNDPVALLLLLLTLPFLARRVLRHRANMQRG